MSIWKTINNFKSSLIFSLALVSFISLCDARIGSIITLPSGNDTEVQFNDNGVFGSSGTFTYDKSTDILSVSTVTSTQLNISSITFADGSIQYTAPSGGGGGINEINDLSDVDVSGETKNYHLVFNGSQWVAAPDGTSFTFSINTFTDNQSSTVLMGPASTVWVSTGNMSFSATYNNGPPTSSTVTHSGWSDLVMTGSGLTGPTTSQANANYPASPGSKTWTLNSTDGTDSDTSNITINFYNYRIWGTTTTNSSFTEAIVEDLANSELSNSRVKTFSVTAGSGEYIVYAYPSRLGTATFTVGGFEGGFIGPETVSITNSAGYTENYYVYGSANDNLGSTTVEVD